ncbi:WhiB family transcriptional regulator [Gordonia sp. VNQ95]|jgi:WhiB family redox-sensing transcriptional regulator|uniref:WhiB family transcriptional regulator n=1 Tax=Gordonia TaxID=2053 RepID=UPI0032B5F84B
MTTMDQRPPTVLPPTDLLGAHHPGDPDWRRARCAAAWEDPEDWFPFPTDDFTHAAQVCAGCPIRPDCEAHGRAHRMSGVWGGVRLENGRQR